jgi:hypothetical protein
MRRLYAITPKLKMALPFLAFKTLNGFGFKK